MDQPEFNGLSPRISWCSLLQGRRSTDALGRACCELVAPDQEASSGHGHMVHMHWLWSPGVSPGPGHWRDDTETRLSPGRDEVTPAGTHSCGVLGFTFAASSCTSFRACEVLREPWPFWSLLPSPVN